MITREDVIKKLTDLGIEFTPEMSLYSLKKLLPKEPNKTDVLLETMATTMSQLCTTVDSLSNRLTELENKKPVEKVEEVLSINKPQAVAEFFTKVPAEIEAVAREILGDKFGFEVMARKDSPEFEFTIIVPESFSPIRNDQDRRTKVISNAAGVNGVREWSLMVKNNVIKYLGNNITTTKL